MYTIERTDYDEIRTYWTGNTWSTDRHEFAEQFKADSYLSLIVANGWHYGDPLELRRDGQLITAY